METSLREGKEQMKAVRPTERKPQSYFYFYSYFLFGGEGLGGMGGEGLGGMGGGLSNHVL